MGRENKFLRWVGQTFNGSQLVALSFMLLIFSGALLFMLPISTQDRHGLTFLDALFTATSASCVTGLTVIDVTFRTDCLDRAYSNWRPWHYDDDDAGYGYCRAQGKPA